ncbi:hypothetical protein ABW19_dt0207476 [Dactylella cylindrospora]|nr:hypothetical protein ABW19_dt0207476 [Dactylella cylindrospora]
MKSSLRKLSRKSKVARQLEQLEPGPQDVSQHDVTAAEPCPTQVQECPHKIFLLPEILTLILLRLPFIHVIRNRRVCKSWHSLIDSSPDLRFYVSTGLQLESHQKAVPSAETIGYNITPLALQVTDAFWNHIGPYVRELEREVEVDHRKALIRLQKALQQFLWISNRGVVVYRSSPPGLRLEPLDVFWKTAYDGLWTQRQPPNKFPEDMSINNVRFPPLWDMDNVGESYSNSLIKREEVNLGGKAGQEC